jgi:hypothetical protein
MDKSKWYETPQGFRLVMTSQNTGIFESQVNHDVDLYQPPEVGEPLRGIVVGGKEFVTARATEVTTQGATTYVNTKNSSYRLVPRQN